MKLFYHPEAMIAGEIVSLSEEESKHSSKVLRLDEGDIIHLSNGMGSMAKAEIILSHPKKTEVLIKVVDNEYDAKPFRVHIAMGPTKNNSRFEWFLEKATEIGIDEITPIICEYSERRTIRKERLEKVILAAMKQSLKARLPQLNEAISFSDFVKNNSETINFIAYCSDEYRTSLKNSIVPGDDVLVLIGPEGDFSPAEVTLALEEGFLPVSLGTSRLRTETAAMVACHSVNLINEKD